MCMDSNTNNNCCCGCSCSEEATKNILVEFLYLDLDTCKRCIGTEKVLDEVMERITPVLELAGYTVEYNKVKIETEEIAREFQFLSSPTIRVNGFDISTSVKETSCGCCGEISGNDIDCRVYEYNGEIFDVPPIEMLTNDILHLIFGMDEGGCSYEDYYELSDNLKKFFEGKKNKK